MPQNNRQSQKFTPYNAYQAYMREESRKKALAASGNYQKPAIVYAGITVFCLIFCAIYEMFSFGEHSLLMRTMFMVPLLGGAVPFGLMAVSENPPSISRGAFNLWNSGLAVHISGCLVHGIIEISGRVPDYDDFYWIVSGVFLTLAVIVQVIAWRRSKNSRK